MRRPGNCATALFVLVAVVVIGETGSVRSCNGELLLNMNFNLYQVGKYKTFQEPPDPDNHD